MPPTLWDGLFVPWVTPSETARVVTRERGVVQWFHPARGYGFIASRVDGAPVFVSHRDLPGEAFRCLQHGDEVLYTRTIDRHGPVAVDVIACADPRAVPREDDPLRPGPVAAPHRSAG